MGRGAPESCLVTCDLAGVSMSPSSAGGKLGLLLARSCSVTSTSSCYLLSVPGVPTPKQGQWQESHTCFLCLIPEFSSTEAVLCGSVVFYFYSFIFPSLHAMAWLTPPPCSARRVVKYALRDTVLFAWKYCTIVEHFNSTNSILCVLKIPKALPDTFC